MAYFDPFTGEYLFPTNETEQAELSGFRPLDVDTFTYIDEDDGQPSDIQEQEDFARDTDDYFPSYIDDADYSEPFPEGSLDNYDEGPF